MKKPFYKSFWFYLIIVILLFASGVISLEEPTEKTPLSKKGAKTKSISKTKKKSKKSNKQKSVKGRGYSDSGREEPIYKGLDGYIVVSFEEYRLLEDYDFLQTPWKVPTYKKTADSYSLNSKIKHKTKVKVLKQELYHKGYGNYSGYLLVKDTKNKKYYINVSNFICQPYWTFKDLSKAQEIGYFIAEYNPKSKHKPINSSGETIKLDKKAKVLITGNAYEILDNNFDFDKYQLVGLISSDFESYEKHVYFNSQDLKIIY